MEIRKIATDSSTIAVDMPSVVGDPCFLRAVAGQHDRDRRQPEQDRHDLLETLRRRGQQQRGADRTADRGRRKDPLQPGALARRARAVNPTPSRCR